MIEIFISFRYPFPPSSISLQARFYKTFYECERFQLTNDKLAHITSLTKLPSLIKLKQIVKNVSKPRLTPSPYTTQVAVHSYSLYYEIVQNFILSSLGISIIKFIINSKKEYQIIF